MCGIVGYIGSEQAAPILLQGLEKLEYRGYDSAGVAVYSEDGLRVAKAKGRLRVLSNLIDGGKAVAGTLGIGHTRWATHGAYGRDQCSREGPRRHAFWQTGS